MAYKIAVVGATGNVGQRLVAYGGFNGSVLADLWTLTGTTWAQSPNSPSPGPRRNHCMAFDAQRGRLVLFGGSDGTKMYSDTWEWDHDRWEGMVTLVAPVARYAPAMVYDSQRQRMVLFGGHDQNRKPLNDTITRHRCPCGISRIRNSPFLLVIS